MFYMAGSGLQEATRPAACADEVCELPCEKRKINIVE